MDCHGTPWRHPSATKQWDMCIEGAGTFLEVGLKLDRRGMGLINHLRWILIVYWSEFRYRLHRYLTLRWRRVEQHHPMESSKELLAWIQKFVGRTLTKWLQGGQIVFGHAALGSKRGMVPHHPTLSLCMRHLACSQKVDTPSCLLWLHRTQGAPTYTMY